MGFRLLGNNQIMGVLHTISLFNSSPFAMPSLWVRFHRWSIYGPTTDLKRTYCEGRKNVGKSDDLKEKIRA